MAARRVSLPPADDLFRSTGEGKGGAAKSTEAEKSEATKGGTSGRVRHDEKMTVYVTSDELLELEHARLTLRSKHGLAVDRGRLVREAVAIVLADLESNGEQSTLVRRLADG